MVETVTLYPKKEESPRAAQTWFWIEFAVFVAFVIFGCYVLSGLVPVSAIHDAYQDILAGSRFEGNIEKISWLTRILDKGIVVIISLIGFFIISAAMLRNVLSGAYAAYPRLFDMLAETKEQFKNSQGSQGGILKYAISFFIPNIKPLTDFADGTSSTKGYFSKALLQGVITVIIGVCIYNGLYRDLIVQGASLGTHIIENYILKISFTRLFDDLMETGLMYKFVWEGGSAPGDDDRTDVAQAVYRTVIDAYGNVRTSQDRATLGAQVEKVLSEDWTAGGYDSYFGNENYKMTYHVYWTQSTTPTPEPDVAEGDVQFFKNYTMEQLGMMNKVPEAYGPTYVYVQCYWKLFNQTNTGIASGVNQLNNVTIGGPFASTGEDAYSLNLPQPNGKSQLTGSGIYQVQGTNTYAKVSVEGSALKITGYYELSNGTIAQSNDNPINPGGNTPFPPLSLSLAQTVGTGGTGAEAAVTYGGKSVMNLSLSNAESFSFSADGVSEYGADPPTASPAGGGTTSDASSTEEGEGEEGSEGEDSGFNLI